MNEIPKKMLVIGGRALKVIGRLQREGGITHLIAEKIEDIAARPDGGFVVVYEFRSGDDGDLLVGVYDDEGNRIAQEFVVSDDSVNGITYDNASVDVSPDGRLLASSMASIKR